MAIRLPQLVLNEDRTGDESLPYHFEMREVETIDFIRLILYLVVIGLLLYFAFTRQTLDCSMCAPRCEQAAELVKNPFIIGR